MLWLGLLCILIKSSGDKTHLIVFSVFNVFNRKTKAKEENNSINYWKKLAWTIMTCNFLIQSQIKHVTRAYTLSRVDWNPCVYGCTQQKWLTTLSKTNHVSTKSSANTKMVWLIVKWEQFIDSTTWRHYQELDRYHQMHFFLSERYG